jgi:hypothetical protein
LIDVWLERHRHVGGDQAQPERVPFVAALGPRGADREEDRLPLGDVGSELDRSKDVRRPPARAHPHPVAVHRGQGALRPIEVVGCEHDLR